MPLCLSPTIPMWEPETIDSALRNFRQVRETPRVNITTGQTISKEEGTVLRIASETIDNTVTYKLILEENRTISSPCPMT